MHDDIPDPPQQKPDGPCPSSEGGLHAPPGLGFWGTAWWWFHFVILVNLARFRFIAILLVIGMVILMWDNIIARYDKWTRPAGQKSAASSNTEYFCPMHPTVIRDNPKEKCPICFMPLSKRKKGDVKEVALPAGIVNRLQLSPYRVVLAGIETWKVKHVLAQGNLYRRFRGIQRTRIEARRRTTLSMYGDFRIDGGWLCPFP